MSPGDFQSNVNITMGVYTQTGVYGHVFRLDLQLEQQSFQYTDLIQFYPGSLSLGGVSSLEFCPPSRRKHINTAAPSRTRRRFLLWFSGRFCDEASPKTVLPRVLPIALKRGGRGDLHPLGGCNIHYKCIELDSRCQILLKTRNTRVV